MQDKIIPSTRRSGLHLWAITIRANLSGSCSTETVKLWITTKVRSVPAADKATRAFLKRNKRTYYSPVINTVKYRGTIDA